MRAIFQVQAPAGAHIWRGDLTEGCLCYLFRGTYFWRGLFLEFFGTLILSVFDVVGISDAPIGKKSGCKEKKGCK